MITRLTYPDVANDNVANSWNLEQGDSEEYVEKEMFSCRPANGVYDTLRKISILLPKVEQASHQDDQMVD